MNRVCAVRILAALCTSVTPALTQIADSCDRAQSALLYSESREALNAHQYDVAERRLREALTVCPSDRRLLFSLAEANLARRDFAEAISNTQAFLEAVPQSIAGRVMLADAYFMAGRLKEALAETEVALRADARNMRALKIKANACYLLGSFENAKETLIDLMEQHPKDEEAPYMLGRMYYQERYVDLAIGQFERVLRLNPSSYKALDNLGLCYQARGEDDKAIRYFLSSIKLVKDDHPEYDWPYANLADLLIRTGDNQKAYDAAAKAAERNPNSARNFYLGGKALCNLGKIELCLNWLQRSISLDPDYPEAYYLLARVYHQMGQEQKSAETRKKFLEAQAKVPNRRR
jgi:tetratricopeptide (TPR) repeat protein